MKNYFFIAAISLLVTACNQGEIDKSKAELSKSNRKIDSLMVISKDRESSINDFISSFNDVERNLDSVAAKQHIISLSTDKRSELKLDQKARINSEIVAINNLMDTNRKRIANLNQKLKGSAHKNAELEKTIVFLNEQLVQKESELVQLNKQLSSLNIQVAQLQTSVETLVGENAAKAQNIAEKTIELHTAYYVIGKSKELQVSKIIDRKGGVLGMGKTSLLNSNPDKSKFTKIDYTLVDKIEINSDGVKIVTAHPADSYTLEKDGKDKGLVKNLVITNPDKFWSASKYLVIVKG